MSTIKLGYTPTIINNGHEIQVLTWFMLARWHSWLTTQVSSSKSHWSHLSAGEFPGLVVFMTQNCSLSEPWGWVITALGCSQPSLSQFRWSLFGTQVNREHKVTHSLRVHLPTWLPQNQQTFHLYKFDLYLYWLIDGLCGTSEGWYWEGKSAVSLWQAGWRLIFTQKIVYLEVKGQSTCLGYHSVFMLSWVSKGVSFHPLPC